MIINEAYKNKFTKLSGYVISSSTIKVFIK